MNISYWHCPFSDCDDYYDENEGYVWIYACSHHNNKAHYCFLDNKIGGAKDDCVLLDKNELDPSGQI